MPKRMTTVNNPNAEATDEVVSAPPWSSSDLSLWIPPEKHPDAVRTTPTPGMVAPPRPRPRVLLVDDDPSIVEITTLILQFSGYEVLVAEDGEQAWCAYLEYGCDLLLTDQDMPHLSGLELIERIRSQPNPVPVILTSGRVACDELPAAVRARIDAVLPKPFASDLLLETIRACLCQQAS